MTDLLNDVDTPSDGELISRVRGGDVAAYGELFSRHRDAAHRLARQLVRGPDADDLVSEAFAKVLTVIQNGGGPDVAFRAYLLTAVRRLHVDRVRAGQRLQTTDDMTPFDPGVPFQDTAVAGFESGAAAKAFASLPERWQLVLWHLEVEGQKPAEIAPLLGMSANSVSALAYRAREGLRQAFLTMHLSDISETDCRWVNEHLGAFVRKGLSKRDAGKVRSHLDGCRRCTAMYLELNEVNSNLAGIIAPLLLGAAAAGYAASAGGAGSLGVLTLLSRAKDVVAANTSGVVAGTVSAGVAAAAVATIVVAHGGLGLGGRPDQVADPGRVQTTAVSSGTPGAASTVPSVPGTSPSASAVPTSTAPTASLSGLPLAVPTPSLSESPFATPSATPTGIPTTPPLTSPPGGAPTPSLAADQVSPPPSTSAPTDVPSSSSPSSTPTDSSSAGPTDVPTQAPSDQPMPERVIGAPVVSAAGDFVTTTVRNMRPSDVLQVTLSSAQTTFGSQLAGTSCHRVDERRVDCAPGPSLLEGHPSAGTGPGTGAGTGGNTGANTATTAPITAPSAGPSADTSAAPSAAPGVASGADTGAGPGAGPSAGPDTGSAIVAGLAALVSGETDTGAVVPTVGPNAGPAVVPVLGPNAEPAVAATGSGAPVGASTGATGSTGSPGAATYGDYTITVPLAYPAYMVSDRIEVTASIPGAGSTSSGPLTLTPSRQATYDFPALQVAGPQSHTLTSGPDGPLDSYSLTTTVALPPRESGVRYTVGGAVRFGSASTGCTVGADGSSMSCPDATDGDQVTLPLTASSLTAAVDVDVAASPLGDVVDSTPGDQHATVHLRPGADLTIGALTAANPDAGGAVALSGTLAGLRPGLTSVVYTVSGGVSFDPAANPACTPAGPTTMTCPAPGGAGSAAISGVTGVNGITGLTGTLGSGSADATGTFTVAVRADDLTAPTPVALTAAPAGDFVAVGADAHSGSVTVRPVHDFSLTGLSQTGHTLLDGVDRYTLSSTVGTLPAGVDSVAVALESTTGTGSADDLTFSTDQGDPACHLDTTAQAGGQVVCTGVSSGDRLDVDVQSATAQSHTASLRLLPTDPYDDPDPSDDAAPPVTLLPGTHVVLSPSDLGDLHQATDGPDAGDYAVTTTVSGLRDGVGEVHLTAGQGARIVGSRDDACQLQDATLVCTGLGEGGTVAMTVRSDTPTVETALRLTATPGAAFEAVSGDQGTPDNPQNPENVVTGTMVPSFDFSMGDLRLQDHTLAGNGDGPDAQVDVYTLTGTVPDQPGDVDSVVLELTTGGVFDADQPGGCARQDDSHLLCTGVADGGSVTLRVHSTSTAEHAVAVSLQAPPGYDDPRPDNDLASLTVRPGVDLRLAALDADNASPANDDDRHLVTTHVSGVRTGLGAVSYDLSGPGTFVDVDAAGCTVSPKSVLCSDPRDGDLTFTVHADDPHMAAAVTVTARPGDPFVELAPADNSDSVRLLPRPTYDFGIGTATVVGHTLAGQVDRYTLRATLGAVPDGLDGVTVEVTGAQVADGQDGGCAKVDDTHLGCTGLGSSRVVDLAVTSTATERHAVTLTVRPPAGYADPDGSDDTTAVTVGPAVDLRLSAPTPAVPVRSTTGTYDVTTVLSGVRSGPVTFTVSGAATVTDASCAVDSPTQVTCADPADGQAVRFTLHPDHPAVSTPVSIIAHAADVFEELEAGDNTVATTLTPDLSLDSLTVLRHRDGNSQAVVAAQVSGVPAGVTSVRVRLSGPAVGLGAGQVHLTDGQEGADAEGLVTCTTTDATGTRLADGVYATCTRVDEAVDGHFQVVMRVAHPHGTPSDVTFTILPLGLDEGGHTGNDSRSLTIL